MSTKASEDYLFPREYVENMLLKKSITDKKFLGIMSDSFEPRWFEGNVTNSTIMKLSILYMKKCNKVPSIPSLTMMAKKYAEKHSDVNFESVESKLMEISNFKMPEEEMVLHDLEKYVFEQSYYYAVSDSVKEVKTKNDISKIVERFDKINKIMIRDDNLGTDYFSKNGQESFWNYIKNPEAKISTGWTGLDHATHGGFLKEGRMLALFVGQPGIGKSLFLANIAVNFLAQNKSVVVISLEMSENVYCSRFASIISKSNINRLKDTMETSRGKVVKFYEEHPDANLIVKEYPPSSIRVVDVERYLDKLVENGTKIDVIVIDYLNLLLPNTKEEGMYSQIKKVSEQLRALSYKYNAPVISATQANRSGTNNENIDLTNISESTGQSQTADWIGMLFRSDEDQAHGVVNVRIAKNRFGAPGKILQFHQDPASLELVDVTMDAKRSTNSEADRITENLESIRDEVMDI